MLVRGVHSPQFSAQSLWPDDFRGLVAGVEGTHYQAEYESENFPKTEYVGPITVLDFDSTTFTARRHPSDHSYYMAFGYTSWTRKPTWKIQLDLDEVDMSVCNALMRNVRGIAPSRPPRSWTLSIIRTSEKGMMLMVSINLYWPLRGR